MSEANGETLPSGWIKARLGDVVSLTNGYPFKPADWQDSGLPIIRIQNLNNADAPFNRCPNPVPEKFKVKDGDLLFAWSGTPGTSFGAHIWNRGESWLNQHIFRVEFDRRSFDVRFLRFAINQNLTDYIRQAHGGAGLAHITKGRFENSLLLVAPLAEQQRIADTLDELLSDLDAGIAAVDGAQRKLNHYRAAVLKAAVEGSLTADWRKQHPAVEPASKLLDRILAERRRRWEEDQLRKFAAAGKEPPKGWKARYKEPAEPDTSGLPEFAPGWTWASFEMLASDFESGSTAVPQNAATKFPILRSSSVRAGHLDLGDVKYLEHPATSLIEEDDLLFVRLSGSLEYVGCCARVRGVTPRAVAFPDRLFRARLVLPATSRFTELAFRSSFVRQPLSARVKSTAGHKRISTGDVTEQVIPLPPLSEQHAIVEAVEDQLSVIDHLEADLEAKLKAAQGLRQSILRHAFSGKLVPQDPTYEPAAELLKRIAAERDERTRQAATEKKTRQKAVSADGAPRKRTKRDH